MIHAFDDHSLAHSLARTHELGCARGWSRIGLAAAVLSLSSCRSFEFEQALVGTPELPFGGRAIAVDKSLAVVGVGEGSDTNPFAVDVFERERDGGWSFVQRLTALPENIGSFGTALALSGRTLAVGAPSNDDSATPELESGYVDIFERGPSGFVRAETVLPGDFHPPLEQGSPGEFSFGSAVSLDERFLAVGAKRFLGGRGRVFVFDRSDYSQLVELAEPAAVERFDANFGDSVQLSGGHLLVTRPDTPASTPPPKNGRVYVYTSANGFSTPQLIESESASTSFDGFGNAAAIAGDTIAVRDEVSVQLFEQVGQSWQFLTQIPADDASRSSLALDAERLFVGEPSATAAGSAGAGQVRIFDRSTVPLTLESTLLSPSPAADARFGAQLSVSRHTLGVTTGDAEQAFVFRRR